MFVLASMILCWLTRCATRMSGADVRSEPAGPAYRFGCERAENVFTLGSKVGGMCVCLVYSLDQRNTKRLDWRNRFGIQHNICMYNQK